MKNLVEFLKGVKANEKGLEDFEALKPELSDEEIEVIDTVFEFIVDVTHWAAEQTLCAAGILVEAKDDYDPKAVVKAMKVAAKFAINPMLILRLIHSIGLDIRPGDLLGTLAEEYKEKCHKDKCEDCTCEHDDDEQTIEDVQKELIDMIRKFDEN